MINLRLVNKEELTNLEEKIRETKETDFGKSFGGRSAWATDILELKTGTYSRSEGAYITTIVTTNGNLEKMQPWQNSLGIRPAVKYSELKKTGKYIGKDKNGIHCIEYGEYPQSKVEEEKSLELTKALKEGYLKETEKTYSVLNKKPREAIGLPLCFGGYVVDEKKHIIELKEYKTKDGNKYVMNQGIWYKVEPIVWQIDKNNDLALTKNILNNGLLYGFCPIKQFMEKYLSKDIIPSRKSKVKVTKVNVNKLKENTNLNKNEAELGASEKTKVKTK